MGDHVFIRGRVRRLDDGDHVALAPLVFRRGPIGSFAASSCAVSLVPWWRR